MKNRFRLALYVMLLTVCTGIAVAQTQSQPQQAKEQTPDIAGAWTGTWGTYSPAQGTTPPKDICKKLDAKVEQKDGVWQAVFEGDCGRPYKYTIKMEGRQVGKVVMFKGTTDLGAKDGGVFDWIGRANDKEFVGFFTSAFYTGTFNLSRTKN
ncbi:MAG TPA: hypothetical protein PLD20_11240 [Blastocatellia bacterium]|nr:hypothetical protein [Blastocatellia bacterium]HMY76550.1 hypothetical protein [Blastocatellia bacterium]HMZ18496.1 hypothetical protein [Blastocatellia bacterium]HNG30537.1 hypothetical protein [Blastocatellia bacterium]